MSGETTRPQTFAAMSAVLTGFQSSVISPELDPINLNGLYLQTADTNAGSSLVDQLLAQFQSLQGQPNQTIANTLLAAGNANPPATAWRAAQAHPMGYSQLSFGYWTSPPPTLEQFGVDLTPEGGSHG